MRKLVLLLSLAVFGSACVGQIDNPPPGTPGDDVEDPPPDDPPPPPPPPNCKPTVTDPAQLPDGHHNPTQDCNGACHDHGFTLGGTLLSKQGQLLVGATITVTDAGGQSVDLVTGSLGNFYTSQPFQFPVTVSASSCDVSPQAAPMISKVNENEGGCAKSGCHVDGQVGATGSIEL